MRKETRRERTKSQIYATVSARNVGQGANLISLPRSGQSHWTEDVDAHGNGTYVQSALPGRIFRAPGPPNKTTARTRPRILVLSLFFIFFLFFLSRFPPSLTIPLTQSVPDFPHRILLHLLYCLARSWRTRGLLDKLK